VNEDTLFDNAYNGPRDGTWDVGSSVGSFVDDRCPTVYGYRSQARSAGREPRINDGLVKKLMQATVENKRAAAAVALARQNVTEVGPTNENDHKSSAPQSAKASRPFVVPPLRSKPNSPTVAAPSHKNDRQPSQKPPMTTRRSPKPRSEFRAAATREAAAPVAEAAKARSDATRGFTPDTGTIRILGKNGEEAFVSLPSLAKSVHAASHRTQQRSVSAVPVGRSHGSAGGFNTREMVAVPEAVVYDKQNEKETKQQIKQQNKQRQNEDEQPMAESLQVDNGGSQRATSALMSGALPYSSREPSLVQPSAVNSCRDSGIAMSDYNTIAKTASSRASSARSGSAISQGVLSIAQQIAKISPPTSTAKMSDARSTAAILEGFKKMGLGMTTGFPTHERKSDRSDDGRAKQVSSRHSSRQSVMRDSDSVRQQREGNKQETARSNYKPPTVVSASSSASVTHSFGGMHEEGMYEEGFAPQIRYSTGRQDMGIGSRGGNSDQPRSVKSGSLRSEVNENFDMARSRQSRSSSRDHQSEQSVSIRSNIGSSVQSGANDASDVVNLRQSRSGSQANRSDRSRGARSVRGSFVQSVASSVSAVASSKQTQLGSRATSVAHSRSNRASQASGTRCPSHSPVSPLAPSLRLFTPDQEQTNFAGDGWISPHPLDSDAGIPPQSAVSAIYASADGPGHCGTLTYSEWRAHRDALGSDAGGYVGSHVPSAVGLQPLPPTVYSHPPPDGYVGSYNPATRRPPRHLAQMDGEPAWVNQYFSPLQGSNAKLPSLSVRDQRDSPRSKSSIHSQSGSTSTAHNNSLYNEPVHQTHSVASQNPEWSFPPHDDHAASSHAPVYNVGLTPVELANYQSQLGNTISHHSSRLSHVQREQTPQPNYEVWNIGQSHSSRRSTSHHSTHRFPPNLSYPRVKSQLAMPWDPTTSQVNSRSAISSRQPSSHSGSSRRGRHTSSAGGVDGLESRLQSNASSSRGSVRSRSSFDLADSRVTYGTVEWQNLENAEEGHGGFQAPQSYNMR